MASIKAPSIPATVAFSTRLDPAVLKALNAYCAAKGTTKTNAVDKALRKLLKLPA